jgi:hypothetical protein
MQIGVYDFKSPFRRNCFHKGQVLRIREPFFKVATSGALMIRVDNPDQDCKLLEEKAFPGVLQLDSNAWNTLGKAWFTSKRFRNIQGAEYAYRQSVRARTEALDTANILNNMALVDTKLGLECSPRLAMVDAGVAIWLLGLCRVPGACSENLAAECKHGNARINASMDKAYDRFQAAAAAVLETDETEPSWKTMSPLWLHELADTTEGKQLLGDSTNAAASNSPTTTTAADFKAEGNRLYLAGPGNERRAREQFQRGVTLVGAASEGLVRALCNLAACFGTLGQHGNKAEVACVALRLNPNHAKSWHSYCSALKSLKVPATVLQNSLQHALRVCNEEVDQTWTSKLQAMLGAREGGESKAKKNTGKTPTSQSKSSKIVPQVAADSVIAAQKGSNEAALLTPMAATLSMLPKGQGILGKVGNRQIRFDRSMWKLFELVPQTLGWPAQSPGAELYDQDMRNSYETSKVLDLHVVSTLGRMTSRSKIRESDPKYLRLCLPYGSEKRGTEPTGSFLGHCDFTPAYGQSVWSDSKGLHSHNSTPDRDSIRIFHSFSNTAFEIPKDVPVVAGGAHVAIGFVDFHLLVDPSLQGAVAQSTPDAPFRFVGVEAVAYAVAKFSVLYEMMKAMECSLHAARSLVQVWYSSVWSTHTLTFFKQAACAYLDSLADGTSESVRVIVQLWIDFEPVSMSVAREVWWKGSSSRASAAPGM